MNFDFGDTFNFESFGTPFFHRTALSIDDDSGIPDANRGVCNSIEKTV